MPLVNAKCTNCGANIKIDNTKDAAICEHCGSAFIVEKAINNYDITNNNIIHTQVVNIYKNNSKLEQLVDNAITYINLREFDKASNVYYKLTNEYPDDYRGWFGLFTTPFYRSLNSIFSFNLADNVNLLKYLTYAIELCEDNTKLTTFFDFIINSYGIELKTKSLLRRSNLEMYNHNGQHVNIPTINNLTRWLIYHTEKVRRLINYEPFDKFIDELTNIYIHNVETGNIFPSPSNTHSLFFSSPVKSLTIWNNKFNIQLLSPLLRQIKCKNVFSTLELKSNSFGIICERWIYINQIFIKSPIRITKETVYKVSNLCPYCGGTFKGLFNKVCSNPNCGKPKDY